MGLGAKRVAHFINIILYILKRAEGTMMSCQCFLICRSGEDSVPEASHEGLGDRGPVGPDYLDTKASVAAGDGDRADCSKSRGVWRKIMRVDTPLVVGEKHETANFDLPAANFLPSQSRGLDVK